MVFGQLALVGGVALTAASHNPLWLIRGLIINGAGMGLVIAPITGVVIARVLPVDASGASGALSAVMQVSGAVGIAVIGGVFYSAAARTDGSPTGMAGAFQISLLVLIAISIAVIIGVQCIASNRSEDPS